MDRTQLIRRARRMRVDAASADVFRAFDRNGLAARLLKGPSIARWLYDDASERSYVDCDVLVAPDSMPGVERALESLGYEREYDDRTLPDWWREHASAWLRHRDGVSVDLHRTLVGVGVSDADCWRLLAAEPVALVVGGTELPALRLPARALHVALHAAQHGPAAEQSLIDLERAVQRCDAWVWRAAATLAARLRAQDALAAGLGLCEPGQALVAELRLAPASSVDTRLRAAGAPSAALGFEALASAEGARTRAAMVWRKLAPPPEFMRHWDPRASRGSWALAAAYARRTAWILASAPSGLSAWLEARRRRS